MTKWIIGIGAALLIGALAVTAFAGPGRHFGFYGDRMMGYGYGYHRGSMWSGEAWGPGRCGRYASNWSDRDGWTRYGRNSKQLERGQGRSLRSPYPYGNSPEYSAE